jgi:DNA-binding transcriptional ArsR family regulator
MRRDPFQAIADPTRREIIRLLARQSLNLNAIAENFDISRPAISKQIKILTQCGLILVRKRGRERYCEANLRSLGQVSDWVDQYRVFWTGKLDALESFLARESSSSGKANQRTASRHSSKKSKRK